MTTLLREHAEGQFAEELDVPSEGLLRITTEPVEVNDTGKFRIRHRHRTLSAVRQ